MDYKISALYSGAGIIVTYKCTAACLHCCYSSSPRREGEYMSRKSADKIFALLNKAGCGSVHIGGGEPFINFEGLLDVCKSARDNNIAIDYIETNGSWFTDEQSVSQKLKELTEAGVDCLLISVDPFHNEFIPYAKIKSLIRCCEKNNFGTFVWQSKFERVVRRLDENKAHELCEYQEKFGPDFIKNIADTYGIGYNGRALRILEGSKKQDADNFLNERCAANIKSLHHYHVDLNGDFIPPGCIGFKVNIFDLVGEGLDDEKYANFLAVANGGLSGLYERALSLGFEPDADGYASKCGLCFDIKKYMLENFEPYDIGPAGFFDES